MSKGRRLGKPLKRRKRNHVLTIEKLEHRARIEKYLDTLPNGNEIGKKIGLR